MIVGDTELDATELLPDETNGKLAGMLGAEEVVNTTPTTKSLSLELAWWTT